MLLEVSHIKKCFLPDKPVLDNISFSVESGEIFGLVGLNGIGKTTLIKIILDLLRAEEGTVLFSNRSNQEYQSRKAVFYLPEKFYPSPHLTGLEFLEISLHFFGKTLDRKVAEEYAIRVDLEPACLQKKIQSYSKGMGQKIGLLSCVLSGAQLLILDEPMSGLDPKSRVKVKELLADYQRLGNAIFFSSHILADVDELCDRIAVLNGGRFLFEGTPEKFKQKYADQSLEKAFLKCITPN